MDTRVATTFDVPVDAVVAVPGSKSIANRALVCAALADGSSTLTNVPDGDDTVAMAACLTALGVGVGLDGAGATVVGTGGTWADHPATLHAGLAGTTSRFVTALAALGQGPIVVDGDPPLRRRPFGPLHSALTQLGAGVSTPEGPGTLPATITGPPSGRRVELAGDVSSQFVTALMLIAPLLADGLEIELTSTLVSRPYVELTAIVMGEFGFEEVEVADDRVVIGAGRYEPTDLGIEPDASSASYPLAMAIATGGTVVVPGLGDGAVQGDARFADLLADMGAAVERDAAGVRVTSASELRGIDVDMADVSDLVPTVAVVAALATTPTTISGVGFIRTKESDRLGDLAHELRLAGVDIAETADGLHIRPSLDQLRPARLGTHHDHRLAMAFGVLGSVQPGIEVENPSVVSKSWPGFWEMLEGLRR